MATFPNNVFYLTGFNAIAHKSDEPRVCAVILSRHAPGNPIIVVAEYYLATFLTQETWVEDIRPFRAVMLPLDLHAKKSDIDRFIPLQARGKPWIENARKQYTFDMATALKGALKELKLDRAKVAFDDYGVGIRLDLERGSVADGYDPLMFARSIKTPAELNLLRRATKLNEMAIRRTIASCRRGRHGVISTSPMPDLSPSSAALCAIRAAWSGGTRAAPSRRLCSRPRSRTAKWSPERM